LNRYFAQVGELTERKDGYIDRFVGDGLMAIFGVGGQPYGPILSVNAALQTLAAVDRMKPFFASMYGIDFDIRMVCIGAKAADHEAMMDAGLGGMKAALKLTSDQNPASRPRVTAGGQQRGRAQASIVPRGQSVGRNSRRPFGTHQSKERPANRKLGARCL
jgi:class 3 adenylate cyclase